MVHASVAMHQCFIGFVLWSVRSRFKRGKGWPAKVLLFRWFRLFSCFPSIKNFIFSLLLAFVPSFQLFSATKPHSQVCKAWTARPGNGGLWRSTLSANIVVAFRLTKIKQEVHLDDKNCKHFSFAHQGVRSRQQTFWNYPFHMSVAGREIVIVT